jgi:uncharacterized membrane protein YkoI
MAVSRFVFRAIAATLLAAQMGGALAQTRPALLQSENSFTAFAAQRGGGGISLAQATAMALGRYQGRVVRAEPVMMGERVVYEIRILGNDGRVRTVRIDAQTGAFL